MRVPVRRARRRAYAGPAVGIALVVAAGAVGVTRDTGTADAARATSPAASAPYRHGVVPGRGSRVTNRTAPLPGPLVYGGGLGGAGVVTGAPRVYLVFWGSQWGTASTTTLNGHGYSAFSGDPDGMAPVLQAFFAGLGTGGELWSGVMTQYCQGVAQGATGCPTTAGAVGYPSGGALAGVWLDGAAAAPASASATQIAQEAQAAAGHFGNTSASSNADSQYFIVSPHGTTPDGFNTIPPPNGFCAWHDDTADPQLPGPVTQTNGDLQFTNMPYVTDAGNSCGTRFVNTPTTSNPQAGALDGVTLIGGHEYAETITDPYPTTGWSTGPSSYNENGDLCAWVDTGPGASANLTLATGTFAVQSTYSNADGTCELTRPIAANIAVSPPANRVDISGRPVAPEAIAATARVRLSALTYAASGLPAGLSINPATGVIFGTPTAAVRAANVVVTVRDDDRSAAAVSFTWGIRNIVTVASPGHRVTRASASVRFRVRATDSQRGAAIRYRASGLPPGLRINPRSGLISGHAGRRPRTYRSVIVATDGSGATGRTSFVWSIRR